MAKPPRQRNSAPRPVAGSSGQPQVHLQQVTHQSFEGPIPPPAILSQYDAVVPGAAERILRLAESQVEHRHHQEALVNQANIKTQDRQIALAEHQTKLVFRSDAIGQACGFLVSTGSVIGCVYLAIIGQPWVAVALASLPLAGIVRAFREKPSPQKK